MSEGWLSCFQSSSPGLNCEIPLRGTNGTLTFFELDQEVVVPFYWGRFKEDSVYCRPGNKEIKIDMLKKKRNQHLFSDKAEKPETFAWTPSMSVYSWPQINLSGKYNPPLYHLSLLILAYEHTRMPASGDSQQPMKDKCLLFFFFPVLHENGRQENSPSMQAPISASPGPPHRSLSHTLTYRGLANLNNTGGSVRFFCLVFISPSVSLSFFFFLDRNRSHSCKNGPARFQFTSWTSVNKMSTVSSPPTFRREARRSTVDNRRRGAIDRPIEQSMKASDLSAQVKTTLITHTQEVKWWTGPVTCFFFFYKEVSRDRFSLNGKPCHIYLLCWFCIY